MTEERNYPRSFWVVIGKGDPTYKHDTEQSAKTEARRLAIENPGESFTVALAIATACTESVSWTHYEDPEPPF